MKKLIITILIILLLGNKTNAQLFVMNETYPEITTIKEKYYNGTGGGGYWSIAKLDTLGRIIEKESYRKSKLLARYNYVYNSNNDQLHYIVSFDINHPIQIDTISNYEYKYQGNRIVYQKNTNRNRRDSTVIQLIENKGDTILTYQDKSYYFRPKTNTTDIYERIRTLKYQNGLLVHSEKFDLNRNEKEITYFEYYPNGRLKRRKIEREPEPEFKGYYVGGPGSDNEFYEYKFDKSGRIKTFYRIIGKKKYKIATYKYNKNKDKEVDFMVQKPNNEREYYQVAYTVSDEKTFEREFSSLMTLRDNYPKYVLTLDYDNAVIEGIQKVNVIDWLLK